MSDSNVTSHVPAARDRSIARRCWWWWKASLPVGLLLAVIAVGAVYLLFEPQYEASALLEIHERAQYIAFEPKEAGISKAYFRTQMEIIKSRWILGRTVAAIERIKELPEIFNQCDKIDWLKKQVTVVSVDDSDVFEIKYSGSDPENAALVVNTVTEQYLTAQEEEETKRNRKIVAALTAEMISREEAVRTLRKQVQAATHQLPSMEPEFLRPERNSQAKSPLVEMQNRLIEVQIQSSMLRAQIVATEEELAAAEKANAAEKPTQVDVTNKGAAARLSKEQTELRDPTVDKALAENPEIKQLNSQLLTNRMELKRVEDHSKRGKADPLYIRRQEEIAIIEKNLAELKQELTGSIQKEVESSLRAKGGENVNNNATTLAKRREELARMRNELRSHEIAEIDLRKACREQSEKLFKELEALSGESVNLTFKRDELAEKEAVLTRITERQIAMQTERSAPARVIWHEPAKAPEAPVELLPYRNMALAGLLGFCLPYVAGFFALVLWNLRKLIRKLEPAETGAV